MKKLIAIILLIVSFSLTSCRVNWFDNHYADPWWVIAVPVVIFCAIVWVAWGKHIASKKYVCPKCNKSFYPKWWKAGISIHMDDYQLLKCPHCGRKDFCPLSRETED